MRKGIEVEVAVDDRARLEAIVADRNCRQKHVERGRIVLLTSDGVGTLSIMRQVGCAKATVWRWQERFATEGVAGLLRDKSRPPGKTPLPKAVVERVVERTLGAPPGEATHWTGRAMAAASGVSPALGPADLGSTRPAAAPRQALQIVQGPGVRRQAPGTSSVSTSIRPPHAVVLSVDEKSHVWMAPGPQEKS